MDDTEARRLLQAERSAAELRLQAVSLEFESMVSASVDANADDEHDPEGATVAFERASVAALVAGARAHLTALDRALESLGDGTYSVCRRCGGPIGAERLAALPGARECVDCAGRPVRDGRL